MVALAAVVLGVLLGLGCGGSLRELYEFRLRFEWLLLLLFVIQGVARGRLAGSAMPGAMAAWVAASVGLIAILGANYQTPGMLVAAAGVLLNANVVVLNGAMPLDRRIASGAALSSLADKMAASGGFYALANPGTLLGVFADILPIPVAGNTYLLSVGDVLLLVGVAVAVSTGMNARVATRN